MSTRNFSAANLRCGFFAAMLCFLICEGRLAASTSLQDPGVSKPVVPVDPVAPANANVVMTTNQQDLASANAGFAFNLLQQIATEQPETNIFISPYSVSTALQMVSIGAGGTTQTEMQQVLGTFDMTPTALNLANKENAAILDARNANFVLSTANAIWYRTGTPIKPAFIAENEKFYGAKVEGLNFNSAASVNIINAWASEETHGKIDKIVGPTIDASLVMFLANAVYFLGNWQTAFDVKNTTNRVFYLEGGGQALLPMMERADNFSYSATNGYQAVQLPYKGGDLSMYVFLPGPGTNLLDFLDMMSGAWWQQSIASDFSVQNGILVLPKFNLSYAVDLVAPLEVLGMPSAFTPNANFTNMSSKQLYISDVKQQAVVQVDEEGTVAAAVTTVGVVDGAVPPPPPPPFQMIVDRPFLFFIEDQQAGTILFMGMVFNP